MSRLRPGLPGVAVGPWFPLVLALVFVAHFAGGSNWVMSNYALQGEVPDRLRGRVFATDMMLATLAISVSQLAWPRAWWTMSTSGWSSPAAARSRSSTRSAGGSPPAGCRCRPAADPAAEPVARRWPAGLGGPRQRARSRFVVPTLTHERGADDASPPAPVRVGSCPRPAPTSARASTRSAWRWPSTTTSPPGSTDGGVRVTVTGRGRRRAARRTTTTWSCGRCCATFDGWAAHPAGWRVDCVNRIPQARGLGSSSAAIVGRASCSPAALVAAAPRPLDDAGALRLAAELEGHPDNVAPCLLGGFTIAWTDDVRGAGPCALEPAAGVRPTRFRPRRARADRDGAGGAAGDRAARRRGVQRGPGGAAGARADRRARRCSSRRPRTGCTRATGRRACPATAALVAALRAAGVAAVVSGAGPDRAGALTDRAGRFPRSGNRLARSWRWRGWRRGARV